MLDPTDVLIERHPVLGLGSIEDGLHVVGVGVPEVVPGRVDEGVHSVGLPARLTAALGTRGGDPILDGRQW